jgi:beta-lactamase class C
MKLGARALAVLACSLACLSAGRADERPAVTSPATDGARARIASVVENAVRPLMQEFRIPGMAIGIVAGGESRVFNYGVASIETRRPITDDTLFELGSISKTFTATLTAYAQVRGRLSLTDPTAKYLPSLRGSEFGRVTLLNLGTHTPGGLPLQVPDDIRNDEQLLEYLRTWRPSCAPGTCRTYSNPGIGTLGLIAAKSTGEGFEALIEQQLLPALGMHNTYINVPAARMASYAEGYTQDGSPVRMKPAELWPETYGIKSTAADLVRFMEANMMLVTLEEQLQRAIAQTHTGYFRAGVLTQDLIWEQYAYPVALQTLLEGNSYAMINNSTPATAIVPPQQPRADVWINKTGTTNGFGAYVAFIPALRLGIVMLANTNYPIDARVKAAYLILTSLAPEARRLRRMQPNH